MRIAVGSIVMLGHAVTRSRVTSAAVIVAGVLAPAPLRAQGASQAASPVLTLEPLAGYNFHLNAAAFLKKDPRFTWDAALGGDVDLIDYKAGRLNFLADYEVVLGEELRGFDPNQGNFTLDVSSSYRFRWAEVALVFHHVSRHLVDRPKVFPIDWNMIGLRASRTLTAGRLTIDGHARLLGVIKKSFVDYRSELGAEALGRYRLNGRLSAIGGTGFTVRGVDSSIHQRGTLGGAHLEGGVRLEGSHGAGEIFLVVEHRIDADPIDRAGRSWALVGFRLLSK